MVAAAGAACPHRVVIFSSAAGQAEQQCVSLAPDSESDHGDECGSALFSADLSQIMLQHLQLGRKHLEGAGKWRT